MHRLFVIALLVPLTAASAEESRRRPRTDLDVVVPVDPRPHEDVYWFSGRHHHAVPGTVTINKAPYVCDADKLGFDDEESFVAHVRKKHGVRAEELREFVVVRDEVVHFIDRDHREGVDTR